MTRIEANRLIVKRLADYIEKNPGIRMGQALVNLSIIYQEWGQVDVITKDPFYEESVETLKRINAT